MSTFNDIKRRMKAAPKKDLFAACVCGLICVGLLVYFVTLFL